MRQTTYRDGLAADVVERLRARLGEELPDVWASIVATPRAMNGETVEPGSGPAPVDWHHAFAAARTEPDWLVEPLLERGRQIALFSEAKAGKSLLTLELCAALAAGRPVLGNPARGPVTVVYVDLENAPDDFVERLRVMGYGPDDLDQLVYYSFPSLAYLDSAAGGRELTDLVRRHDAELVVIDTLSRVVEGEENAAETYHAFYRYAGVPMKHDGRTLLRLDHSGKDAERGMRGSSAKTSDVDAVWSLTKHDERRLTLRRTHSRNAHGADRVVLERTNDPHLRHRVTDGATADPVERAVALLDELGVPPEAGQRPAWAAVQEAGRTIEASRDAVRDAVARRQEGASAWLLGAREAPRTPAAHGDVEGARDHAAQQTPTDPRSRRSEGAREPVAQLRAPHPPGNRERCAERERPYTGSLSRTTSPDDGETSPRVSDGARPLTGYVPCDQLSGDALTAVLDDTAAGWSE